MVEYEIRTGWSYEEGKRFPEFDSGKVIAKTPQDAELACCMEYDELMPIVGEVDATDLCGMLGALADKQDLRNLN